MWDKIKYIEYINQIPSFYVWRNYRYTLYRSEVLLVLVINYEYLYLLLVTYTSRLVPIQDLYPHL